ncbi:atp-dependent zn protease [hydrocarbon metagenome]|uniref:Atp-dependent zn protease n=1 Tax=hydrocarbon metagenome TaxID=938273 RepID=A0A0W8FQX8_9ZZZZ
MIQKPGFDNEKYIKEQTAEILKRVDRFDNKLYLEFGGKLLYDYHAARVLPGYDPNVKMRLLSELKDKADVVLCIFAGDIERKKIRADFGITYDADALKLIDNLRVWGINVLGVVITRFDEQPAAIIFKNKLERRGISVYTHRFTKGYPTDVETIVSDEGYGANNFIETKKPLVIVTGPGPGSGKMATCLSQLYHDYKRGIKSGYAKFETFPIWNIPLKHPVNVAYEAATADIRDFNLIDPFHLDAYGEKSVNYNRDVEVFPVLKRILEKITGEPSFYKSPTDMGVNRAGFAIIDDEVTKKAAKMEMIRRYFRYRCEYAMGFADKETVQRVELFLKDFNLVPEERSVVTPAREAAGVAPAEARDYERGNEGIFCGAALELKDGTIIKGSNSSLMHAATSMVIHAVKHLAEIPDKIKLLPSHITDSVKNLKTEILDEKSVSLDLEEALIAISISATNNPAAQLALEKLRELRDCEAHMTHIPTPGDETGLRRLGVNLTTDPNFSTNDLFIK